MPRPRCLWCLAACQIVYCVCQVAVGCIARIRVLDAALYRLCLAAVTRTGFNAAPCCAFTVWLYARSRLILPCGAWIAPVAVTRCCSCRLPSWLPLGGLRTPCCHAAGYLLDAVGTFAVHIRSCRRCRCGCLVRCQLPPVAALPVPADYYADYLAVTFGCPPPCLPADCGAACRPRCTVVTLPVPLPFWVPLYAVDYIRTALGVDLLLDAFLVVDCRLRWWGAAFYVGCLTRLRWVPAGCHVGAVPLLDLPDCRPFTLIALHFTLIALDCAYVTRLRYYVATPLPRAHLCAFTPPSSMDYAVACCLGLHTGLCPTTAPRTPSRATRADSPHCQFGFLPGLPVGCRCSLLRCRVVVVTLLIVCWALLPDYICW